ncbi:MAG: leucine-rich repeat protein, partial [Bacteroidaceae bacterium]|nr:leucine-rich repeat protein [Bacteroidaceae bacterium]
AEGATVSVKQGDITLKDYTFTTEKNPNGTEHNKSYALDARPVIDGTLGGKAEATEDDITALVEQLKEYVGNGITTIIVPGSKSAIITVGNITETAIGEAIYRLSGNGNYDENNPYNGKIDLVLPDVTEIVAMEFYAAFALNSITLPKVTTIGDMAFQGCDHLTKLTFGSVLTTIDEHDGLMFWVGEKVDGCDLFLNCGQMNSQYVPDLATNTWTILHTNEFKSITLTHTGECDECKANQ